jgi:hypothetical protein
MIPKFLSSLRYIIQRKSWNQSCIIFSAHFGSNDTPIEESKNLNTKSNLHSNPTTTTTTTTTPLTAAAVASDITRIPREAHFKNPIVATLWSARQQAKRRLEYGGIDSPTDVTMAAIAAREQSMIASAIPESNHEKNPQNSMLQGKTPQESQTEITYSFSTDELLKEAYQNPWGEMRFGKVSVHKQRFICVVLCIFDS